MKKKNPTSKYFRSWKLCPKPNLAITFWAILLTTCFWRAHFHILDFSTSHNNREHHEKKSQFKQHFATIFVRLTKPIIYRFNIP